MLHRYFVFPSVMLGLCCLCCLCVADLCAQPTFTKITSGRIVTDSGSSNGASWVDYDSDGDLDLFVVNGWFQDGGAGSNALYRNDGGDTFTKITEGPLVNTDDVSSFGNTWADVDNDGDLDAFVIVGLPNAAASRLYLNDGTGGFVEREGLDGQRPRGWAGAWGDIDNDGFVDLVVAHAASFIGISQPNHLFLNDGDPDASGQAPTFTNVTEGPIVTGLDSYTVPSWSDYDQDGDLDLFIGSGPATLNGGVDEDNLYRNLLAETGAASFERITTNPIATDERDGQVMNWIDYDNDGDFDLFVTNWGGGTNSQGIADDLYRNDGGSFTKITEGALVTGVYASLANTWGDFDNDGDLDVFIADGGNAPNKFYDNNGDGTFTRIIRGDFVTESDISWGATAGDYDNDGDLDLYVTNTGPSGHANFLYRNDTDNGNHWFKIKLVGEASNRAGIGAKVRLKATLGGQDVWQLREVSTQNTFNGQNALDVHFGLGDAARVDSLVVEWPSGTVDRFGPVEVDQFVTQVEGAAFGGISVGVEDEREGPAGIVLSQNAPNPFVASTTIAFTLPRPTHVRLAIYDMQGRHVATLVDAVRGFGRHTVDWSSAGLAGGVYLYRLEVEGRRIERLMHFVR